MKAIVVKEFGGPDVLTWEDVPTPTPGPGEVLVQVRAVSVNRTLDLQVRQDGGNYGVTLPLVLGNDPSGVVAAVGRGVKRPNVDDRVSIFGGIRCGSCRSCQAGIRRRCLRPRMLGVQCWGGYAEYLRVPAVNCVAIPDGLAFADATVITRHFPLAFAECRLADLKRGDWTLVMGAAGGLGACVVQVAKLLGTRVIAGAGTDERVAAAVSLGAEVGVNYRRDDLEREVRRITDGRGVDAVFENIADPSLWPGAFNSLARGGRLVTAGAHGGGSVTIDVRRLYQEHLQIIGGLGEQRREDLERALRLASSGELKVLVDRIMPLRDAAAAHRLVETNEPLGKVVLDPRTPTAT